MWLLIQLGNTVEPLLNGHSWGKGNWLLIGVGHVIKFRQGLFKGLLEISIYWNTNIPGDFTLLQELGSWLLFFVIIKAPDITWQPFRICYIFVGCTFTCCMQIICVCTFVWIPFWENVNTSSNIFFYQRCLPERIGKG